MNLNRPSFLSYRLLKAMLYAFAAAPREQFVLRNLFHCTREHTWEDFQARQNQACIYLSIIIFVSFTAQKTETDDT